MSADFWMGIAVGSVLPWTLLIMVLARSSKTTKDQHTRADELAELMRDRNVLEGRSATALETIAKGGLE